MVMVLVITVRMKGWGVSHEDMITPGMITMATVPLASKGND